MKKPSFIDAIIVAVIGVVLAYHFTDLPLEKFVGVNTVTAVILWIFGGPMLIKGEAEFKFGLTTGPNGRFIGEPKVVHFTGPIARMIGSIFVALGFLAFFFLPNTTQL